MKNIFKTGFLFAMAVLLFSACDPQEFDKSSLDMTIAPSAENISFTVTPGTDDFHFTLTNDTPFEGIYSVVWTLGNGTVLKGNEVTAYYPLPGVYDLTLSIVSTNGESISKIMEFEQTETDYSFLDSPTINALTGGASNVDGITWVVDSLEAGHFGIGPVDGVGTEWWAAQPLQKTGSGAYDDEFTFKLVEFVLEFNNNGDSYVKDFQKDNVNYSNPVEVDGTDCRVNYTTATATWSLVTKADGDYLVLSSSKPAFFGFDYGGTYEYRIDVINENEIYMSTIGGDGNRWYNKLIRKGYVRPIVEKPLEANDFMDDFEGNGNIDWQTGDIEQFSIINNFAPVPINTSANIAIYKKGAFEWTNVFTVLDYRLDLSARNVFTIKVFIPSFNDYVTECDPGTPWLATHNLLPQIDLKLQDSKKGGNAWETQQVRSHMLSEDQLGKWVELSFDYSDVSDRTDFDQVVVQFGMEGHCNPGIFYMDDFKLLD